ncbi:EcsC family protein [Propioniciclava soli]|uniref:EcsC family protein n=1 Tax=Propioniciclava soli TaxID=2775081 RepID=UPI001E519736|nr:EcsC family protein [Propioniciclava soli]
MPSSEEIEQQPGSTFSQTLEAAARLPGVRIDRTGYLRAALKRHCTEEQIERAIAGSPAAAGISLQIITEVADTSIAYETTKAAGMSAAAGIPGGLWVIATVPVDAAQYLGHMLRIAQKLAYIYSWPDLFADGGDEIDEATEGILILFVGVMAGVQLAQGGVSKASAMIATQVIKKLPQQALTKGAIYPIVKKVAAYLGVSMTKKLFASGVAKAIPVVGAVLSGGLTLSTFLPMSKKLQEHLASLELTKPGHRTNATDIIDGEVMDMDDVEEFPEDNGEQSVPPGDASPADETNLHEGL